MNTEQMMEVLDLLVTLPTRATLAEVLKSQRPITAAEISRKLNLSMAEVLDYLQRLQAAGIVKSDQSGQNGSERKTWQLAQRLRMEVAISENGIVIKEKRPGFREELAKFFK